MGHAAMGCHVRWTIDPMNAHHRVDLIIGQRLQVGAQLLEARL
jgi:hypothetical protein